MVKVPAVPIKGASGRAYQFEVYPFESTFLSIAAVYAVSRRYKNAEDRWVHVCTTAEGCGFAREKYVRSPIDWRAILIQERPGAPWVLETYVAGD